VNIGHTLVTKHQNSKPLSVSRYTTLKPFFCLNSNTCYDNIKYNYTNVKASFIHTILNHNNGILIFECDSLINTDRQSNKRHSNDISNATFKNKSTYKYTAARSHTHARTHASFHAVKYTTMYMKLS